MSLTARISLPGIDALGTNDPRDFALFADSDNILIKEKARGSSSINNGYNATIAHNLGYVPLCYVWAQSPTSGRYRVVHGFSVNAAWFFYVDSTNLIIGNRSGATRTAKYFIFYDDIPV